MSRDALVVGINTYPHLHDLRAPATDAEAIAQVLEREGEFDIVRRLPEAIAQSQGNQAFVGKTIAVPQSQLKQALKQLFLPSSAQAPETALFYFSGHGLPDKEGYDGGYLVTSDTNPNFPDTGLSLRWLQWLLSKSPIRQQIVWLDCCHSGQFLVNLEAANPGHGESRDRCFIASSRDFESSWQDLNSPYSVLTKALLEGLDPARLPGRWIDSFALADFINQALRGELQKPVCTNFGEAIRLTRTWQAANEKQPETHSASEICPYKGLEFFDCNGEDPKYFYGRQRLTDQLLDQVRTSSFMALVGASGSGKSSVLRAGLLHQLQVGRRIAGSDQWQILITRPDETPMQNLARAFIPADLSQLDRAEALGKAERLLREGGAGLRRLVQSANAPRVLLVIDQFEEAFTRCHNLEERERFFACLMGALSEVDDKLCLILAMRADFVGKCLEQDYSGLAKRVQQGMVSVLPMSADELRDAIGKPAGQVGLSVEPALVTEILNDIAGAPGSLPLLQYTLKELWQHREDNQLVLSAYQALGGISGTLDRRATEIYNSFDRAEQQTVQHIFQQLTQLGEGTEDTRRRVFLGNLIAEPQHPEQRVNQVIATLAEPSNRLLVTSEVVSKDNDNQRLAIVDVAHEALIRHWKLLRQWIEQNRDLLRQQRRIEASAESWQEHQQAKGYLLQGLPLTEALQFQKQQAATFPLSDPAKIFIRQSLGQQRWNRIKTASWLIIPAVIVVGIVEYNLREQSIKADYRRLDSSSQFEEKQGVESLVAGCWAKSALPWLPSYLGLPSYLAERLLGNCRSLSNAPLEKADLRYADLRYANLNSANLSSANISHANLNSANLSSANISHANLNSANLSSANISHANLNSANIGYAYLRYAVLSSTNLSYANLKLTDLSNADLRSAYFSSANLSSANLSSTDLSYAVLNSTDLSYANLSYAVLNSTDLSYAFLLATDLRKVQSLTAAQLQGKTSPYLCNVALPSNITDINPNRDCDVLPKIYSQQYEISLEEAKRIVDASRQEEW